jgi:hypothetical protein
MSSEVAKKEGDRVVGILVTRGTQLIEQRNKYIMSNGSQVSLRKDLQA